MEAIFELPAFKRWETEAAEERRERPAAESIGVPLGRPVETRIPPGPCYAVIFSSLRKSAPLSKVHSFVAEPDYEAAATRMLELARQSPGYLGVESARGVDGFGITVSYWTSLDAIALWRANSEHATTQAHGRANFYSSYDVRVARVEKHRNFKAD
jgi:heme-degrading monooxygenase HmoA